MNNFLKAKKELADMQTARANMLCKLKESQEELDLLKADMIGRDAEDKSVMRYNDSKRRVLALRDVLKEYDRVRLPQAVFKVNQEKVAVDTEARRYLNEKKTVAVAAVAKKLNEGIALMKTYQREVVEYARAEGGPRITRNLLDIKILDMDRNTRRYLS